MLMVFALRVSEIAEIGGFFTLRSSSAVGSHFTKDSASVSDFGYIGRKFEVVFFHKLCILARRWHLIWLCILRCTCECIERTLYASYFGYFGTCVDQKPLTLEQYGFGKD